MMAKNRNKIGNVPNLRFPEFEGEWVETDLGSILKIGNGKDYKHLSEGNIPVFGTGGYMTSVNAYLYDGESVCIGRKGTINKPFYFNGKFWTVDTLFYTHSYKNVFPKFLFYTFEQINWLKYNEASGVPSLSKSTIENIVVSMPNLSEQKKIGDLLSLLDDRISTQSQIIKELKTLQISLIDFYYRLQCYETSILLADCIVQKSERNKKNKDYPVLSVNNKFGFIKQSEQFENREVASEDTSNYKIVRKNDFAYNPARINVGSIARLTNYDSGIISPMYICFHTEDNLLSDFLEFYFSSQLFKNETNKRLEGIVRQCLTFESLCNIPICFPPLDEQRTIALRLVTVQKKIDIENGIMDLLVKQKKYLLQQMFI